MTKKEKLIEIIQEAIDYDVDFVAIAVETKGSEEWEIIINPLENLENKLAYYNKTYNDDLVLNTYDGIKIVSGILFSGYNSVDDVLTMLIDETF